MIKIIFKKLLYSEPCNCGMNIRHNNGGNYHHTIFAIDLIVDGKKFNKKYYTTTSDLDFCNLCGRYQKTKYFDAIINGEERGISVCDSCVPYIL